MLLGACKFYNDFMRNVPIMVNFGQELETQFRNAPFEMKKIKVNTIGSGAKNDKMVSVSIWPICFIVRFFFR